MMHDKVSLWKLLSVTTRTDSYTIDRHYRSGLLTDSRRFAWKALSDPFYNLLYRRTKSIEILKAAGFFDDGGDVLARNLLPRKYMSNHITSLNKVANNIQVQNGKVPAILLTTGAFSPVHNGHLQMMEAAKSAAEDAGYEIVGGFLSPAHDSYVSTKAAGAAKCPIGQRLTMLEKAVMSSTWLEVDPWAGQYLPYDINFTDIISRYMSLLKDYFYATPIKVIYVFGSDNIGFSHVFEPDGDLQGICVAREGFQNQIEEVLAISPNPQVIYTSMVVPDISSTKVRTGEMDMIPEAARSSYKEWQAQIQEPSIYLVRDEGPEALRPFHNATNSLPLINGKRAFRKELIRALDQAFNQKMTIKVMDATKQRKLAAKLVNGRKTISLDAFFKGDHNLALSRKFYLSNGQWFATSMVGRDGAPNILEQVRNIPPGDYVLVEDDVATGYTIQTVKSMLPSGVNITDEIILADLDDSKEEYYDVVDMRDFMVGSLHGGLVVEYPDGLVCRAPYMAPFVNLRSRMKMPPESEMVFSHAIWKANFRLYQNTGVLVEHCPPEFRKLAYRLGFGQDHELADFCHYYAELLEDVIRAQFGG